MELTNHKILIVGASSGIGQATAIDLAKKGAKLVLIARSEDKLKEVLESCEGSGHSYFAVDVKNEKELDDAISSSVKDTGEPFSGFVYSAGQEGTIPLKFVKSDFLTNILQVNTIPALLITKILQKKGNFSSEGGSIIFISSVMGNLGQPAKAAYCMSKGGLVAASKALALELASKKIRVNCISPGMVTTEMSSKILDSISEENIKEIKKMHPLGIGEVEDVVSGITFLISDKSKWITGIDLLIDGGYSAQ
ncbi:SDR family NAD(P)-dependent oxidoreductase [Chryseobacterium jejuense]|uniref:3-oxoacyl-[acyl-carrier-protein] reductase FabG n=1 Tax=Chryseobacterium jejuense TaxID=445960 RepID=A0A2X2XCM6_CHRJE|nr:SDR family oxidoreductase [Chryseobacterium jejuense]SDJ34760.1 NAD(P)-dependent dehydrogenase, short-chain alcohol dehydrogenase family [Chryseobacterium jejuense]SQB45765.1 3-oxoacyl-[acyl-carrier-protein] reductase FabG [Chryseobacterium jejuense]